MDFQIHVREQLQKYSDAEEVVNVTVLNQFEQEFTISGFIPKFHKTRDRGFDCYGVNPHYFILNFGNNDARSTIKLFCPSNTVTEEIHPLTIKQISDNYGNIIFENENYPWVMWQVRQQILNMHRDVNYWRMDEDYEEIAKNILGKAPVYMGYKYPELRGKNCLITGVTKGLVPHTLAIYLKHEDFKTFGIVRLKSYEIDTCFNFKQIQEHLK